MKSYKLFLIFISIILFSCGEKSKVEIAIQPFKNFPNKLTDTLSKVIAKKFNADIHILEQIKLPESAFVNIKSARYRADSLIKFLRINKADNIDYTLGLCTEDISHTKRNADGSIKQPESSYKDWGIFGLAYCPGNSSIVSIKRLYSKNNDIFINRVIKITMHEIGHNYGLQHCKNKQCIMQDAAESIKTIDKVNGEFCSECAEEIQ